MFTLSRIVIDEASVHNVQALFLGEPKRFVRQDKSGGLSPEFWCRPLRVNHGAEVFTLHLYADQVAALRLRPWNGCAAPADQIQAEILAERQRQQDVECYSPSHDDQHSSGDLALAAAAYCVAAGRPDADALAADLWPWGEDFKPKSARADLVRAGALILAEIERLDRAAKSEAAAADAAQVLAMVDDAPAYAGGVAAAAGA